MQSVEQFDLVSFLSGYDGPVVVISRSGSLCYYNSDFQRLFGSSSFDLNESHWLSGLVPESHRKAIIRALNAPLESGCKVPSFQTPVTSGGGVSTLVRWKCTVVKDFAGERVGVVCLGEELEPAENGSLLFEESANDRSQERRLRQVEGIAKLGHWELDHATGVLFWSDEVYRIFEIRSEEFLPSYASFLELIHPEDRELVEKAYSKSLTDRSGYEVVHRVLMSDGREKVVQEKCDTTYNKVGEPLVSFGTVQDITQERSNEARLLALQQAIETSSAGIGMVDLTGYVTYVNQSFVNMWGYSSRDELIGRAGDVLWKDPAAARSVLRSLKEGRKFSGVMTAKRADGEPFEASFYGDLICDDTGAPKSCFGWFLDVTEKRRILQELLHEQNLRKALIETAPVCIKLVDVSGNFISINRTGLKYLELESDEAVIGTSSFNCIAETSRKDATAAFQATLRGESPNIRLHIVGSHGRPLVVDSYFSPIRDEAGNVIAILGITSDVTEQYRTERALNESREQVQAILDQLPLTLLSYDLNCHIQSVQGATLSGLDGRPEDLIGRSVFDLTGGREEINQCIRAAIKGVPSASRCHNRDQVFEIRQSPLRNSSGDQTGVLALMLDVTKDALAQRELEESSVRLQSIFEAITDGVILMAPDGTILDANAQAEKILGFSKPLLQNMTSYSPEWNAIHEDGTPFPADEHPVMVTLRTGNSFQDVIMGLEYPQGTTWITINSEPLIRPGETIPFAAVVTFSDITNQLLLREREREFQADLMRAQRVNLMGELAMAVAHELNQPLTAIAASAYCAEDELKRSKGNSISSIQDHHKLIMDESLRAGQIIARLKNLANRRPPKLVDVDLVEVVGDLARLLKSDLLKKRISLSVENLDSDVQVLGDPVQIQQVLLNLVRNSIDALRLTTAREKQIVISTGKSQSDPTEVVISVSDNGSGIDQKVRSRLFEPYVTNKADGMGMGLPISRAIMESIGGRLTLTSTGATGTSFCCALKLAE